MKAGRARPESTPSAGACVFAAALLLLTLVLLATTRGLPPSAAIVPRVVGVPLALLLGIVTVREIRSLVRARAASAPAGASFTRAELDALLWLLALPALATLLGFVAGPAVYVAGWARVRAGARAATAVTAGVATAAAIVMVFSVLLDVPMPRGILEYLR